MANGTNRYRDEVDAKRILQIREICRGLPQACSDFLRAIDQTDKSSLVFSLPHEEGSLSKILTILSFYNINLTKIQSLPIIGHEWEYLFYVDVTYTNLTRYRQSIDAITPLTKELKILGEYQNGRQTN